MSSINCLFFEQVCTFNCILSIATRGAAYLRPTNDRDDDDRR